MSHTNNDKFLIDNHIHQEATASKARARQALLALIEDHQLEQDQTTRSEWTDMSPSGEFEAIRA